MFQYEDISGRSESLIDGDSYSMRHQYNLFTSGGKHYLPEGGQLDLTSREGNYYTFRTQATYDKTFAELGNDIKNKISHRARAVEKFAQFLFSATCQQ